MFLRKILLGVLISGAGRASAQTATLPAAKSPWLVGLQAAVYPALAQTPDPDGKNGWGRPWPVQLLVRCPTSRGSIEVGLLGRADPATTLSYSDAYGTHTVRATGRTLLVPLVSRLKLLPRHPETWQLDATLGLMLVSSKYQREITYQDLAGNPPSVTGSKSESYSDFPLLGGLGATYRLRPHVYLTADARLSWSYMGTFLVRIFSRDDSYYAPLLPAFSLGAGYTFGK